MLISFPAAKQVYQQIMKCLIDHEILNADIKYLIALKFLIGYEILNRP